MVWTTAGMRHRKRIRGRTTCKTARIWCGLGLRGMKRLMRIMGANEMSNGDVQRRCHFVGAGRSGFGGDVDVHFVAIDKQEQKGARAAANDNFLGDVGGPFEVGFCSAVVDVW